MVEDEEAIRKGIIKSIDWNELGYEVVGDVANGREGLEFALLPREAGRNIDRRAHCL